MAVPEQINFTGELEEDDGAQCLLLLKGRRKNSKLFFRFINCDRIA